MTIDRLSFADALERLTAGRPASFVSDARTRRGAPRRHQCLALPVVLAMIVALAACARTPRGGAAGSSAATAGGGYVKTVLARGSTAAAAGGGIATPGGVAVIRRPDGESVYVADASELREYDGATGALRRRTAMATIDPEIAGVPTLSPDRSLLVLCAAAANRVVVWDPQAQRVVEDHTNFRAPIYAIRFQDSLVVAELHSTSVMRKGIGNPIPTTMVTGLRYPAGLAVAGNNLWVSDRASGTILQIVRVGRALAEPIEVASGLQQPEGLAADADGSLYVAEGGAQRLLRIDPKSRRIRVIDDRLAVSPVRTPGGNPTGPFAAVAVGACGTPYVATGLDNRLLRYAPEQQGECADGR